jgi:hypothetical protein
VVLVAVLQLLRQLLRLLPAPPGPAPLLQRPQARRRALPAHPAPVSMPRQLQALLQRLPPPPMALPLPVPPPSRPLLARPPAQLSWCLDRRQPLPPSQELRLPRRWLPVNRPVPQLQRVLQPQPLWHQAGHRPPLPARLHPLPPSPMARMLMARLLRRLLRLLPAPPGPAPLLQRPQARRRALPAVPVPALTPPLLQALRQRLSPQSLALQQPCSQPLPPPRPLLDRPRARL